MHKHTAQTHTHTHMALLQTREMHGSVAKLVWRHQPQVVEISGEIDDTAANEFATSMRQAIASGQTLIPVTIDSEGGDVYASLRIIECMRQCHVPIATVVLGKAFSGAALIFMCGDTRYVSTLGTVMFHDVACMGMDGTLSDVTIEASEMKRLNDLIFSIVYDKLQLPEHERFVNKLRKEKQRDLYISPKQLAKYGIIESPGLPEFVTRVSLDWELVVPDASEPYAQGVPERKRGRKRKPEVDG